MTEPTDGRRAKVRKISRRALLRTAAFTGAAAAAASRVATPDRSRASGKLQTTPRAPALVFAVADSQFDAVGPLVDDYARHRGVAIEVRQTPADGLLEALTINLTQGTGAYDVVSLEDPWLPALADGGYLADLDGLRESRGIGPDPDFVPGLVALGEFPAGSGLRALPWIGDVQLFGWRADLLAELGLPAPATWDDVLANARAITEAGAAGRFGFGLRGQTGNPAAVSFLPVLRGHGGNLFDEEWQPQLGTPAAMRAMETHLALAALAPPGVESVGIEENGRNLVDGVVAQSADVWPSQLLAMDGPLGGQSGGGIEIGPEPAQPRVRPATMTGAWLLGIPEGSEQPEAALDFVLWLTAPAQQKRLLLDGAMPATRSSVLRDPEAVARFPFLPTLLSAMRGAGPRPRSPYYARVEAIMGGAVAEALAGRLSGEAALRRANAEIRAYLEREGMIEE